MSEPSSLDNSNENLRDQFIGLEEHALRKSYYPQLQQQVEALKAAKLSLERKAEELQAMQRRAEESEANYRELFDKSSEAIIVHDLQGFRVRQVNQAFTKLFGYSHEEAEGLSIADLSAPAQDLILSIVKQHCQSAAKETVRFEWQARRKDASVFWVDVTLSRARIGGETLVLATVRDVTARKQAEVAVIEANRRLEEKVAERTQDLARANQDLSNLLEQLRKAQNQMVQSEKMAALGSLVAGVSHELNTPIGNSLMLASTLYDHRIEFERKMSSGLRKSDFVEFLEDLTEGFNSLMASLHRAAELVGSFKELAVDQASSRRRSFELRDVIQETRMAQASDLRHAGISFHNDIPLGIKLDSFPGPLGQVIGNLIVNAIKHGFEGMHEGDIRISASQPNPSLVTIRFSDNGSGISVENLSKIFDPFFTTKLGQGGSGLGLHIVFNLVTGMLGGAIRVESEPGKGTDFFVTLPLEAPKSPETASPSD